MFWTIVIYIVVGVVIVWVLYETREIWRERDTFDFAGCELWEIDTGESVWVAAYTRHDAIEWYAKHGDIDPDWDEDLDDCCARKPCRLSTEHYKELGCPSEGKETFRQTMEQHHLRGGAVPFFVSMTCG